MLARLQQSVAVVSEGAVVATQATGGRIDQVFVDGNPGSRELYARARRVIAGGVTHDVRVHSPFPVMVERAEGSRKWDVDGNEYIDYTMGHGALILGHAHPVPTQAAIAQLSRGTHYGASHEIETAWAELICELMPSVERVRFTGSGTEATLMAMRLARAHTGRERIVKFHYHFHGWHDYAHVAQSDPLDVPMSAGIPQSVQDTVTGIPTDLDRVREELAKGDVAGLIVEPTGAGWGAVPLAPAFVKALPDLCREHGTVFILDEVVTGFRLSPGGYQALHDVTPDLTTMAKVLAGGLPGGCVGGRADILQRLELRGDPRWDRGQRMAHPGTFNGNPLSAATGVAVLRHIADGAVHAQIDAQTERLRRGIQDVFDRHDLGAIAYGESSYFHVAMDGTPSRSGMSGDDGAALRRALHSHGVHIMTSGGLLSTAHTDEDIDQTIEAFDASVRDLEADGLVGG